MAVCLSTTSTLQSFSTVPVAALVARNIRGQAKGKISFDCGTSNTIRCFPFICLNHSSGSLEPPEKLAPALADKGEITEERPKAATPLMTVPRNWRRGLLDWVFSIIRFLINEEIPA